MTERLTYRNFAGRHSMTIYPHSFETSVDRGPIVTIAQRAYDDIRLLVDECEIEIGWMGLADRTDRGFHVSELFVPKQECNEERTRFEPDALFEILKDMKSRGIESSKLRFWGHSHVRNGTLPSSDDWRQIGVFDNSDWMLTAIANKFGKIRFMAHYYDYGLSIGDIPWMVSTTSLDDARRLAVRSMIGKRVSIMKKPEVMTAMEMEAFEQHAAAQPI